MDKIEITIDSYRKRFQKYIDGTPNEVTGEFKEWIDHFISLLLKNSQIMEIGSATGRDARYFRKNGIEVLCTDVIQEAIQQLAKEGFRTAHFDFRYKLSDELPFFDGIFANAVLPHAPKEMLPEVLANLNRAIKNPGGLIAVSFKNGIGKIVSNEKLDAPKFYQYYSKQEIWECMEKSLFEVVYLKYAEKRKWILCIAKTML